jgi:hypothetical protein
MEWIKHGKVRNGTILFTEPLEAPEGTEVKVRIEVATGPSNSPLSPPAEDFTSLPVFGMWADREDMKDSVAWVNKERAKWHQRPYRRD